MIKICYAKLFSIETLTICFEVNLSVFLHLSELFELGETEIVVSTIGVSLGSVTSIVASKNEKITIQCH